MKPVKMLKTFKASPNGIDIVLYQKGNDYVVNEDLYNVMKKEKVAENFVEVKENENIPKENKERLKEEKKEKEPKNKALNSQNYNNKSSGDK